MKTGALSGVAGSTNLFYLQEKSIAITVIVNADQLLGVARTFTFSPELIAAAAPVSHLLGRKGFEKSLFVHPGDHQDFAVCSILGNCSDQGAFGKASSNICRDFHSLILPYLLLAPYRISMVGELIFDLTNGEGLEVKDTGGQEGICSRC